MQRRRLDAELARRGLAQSREQAQQFIAQGRVTVGGIRAAKPATQVAEDAPLQVSEGLSGPDYASRGAHKLIGALAAFAPLGLVVADRVALDAGASTGGFTDVLLRAGVRHVTAVDVGYGQLAWRLQVDPRVTVLDRTNVRNLSAADLVELPELIVADLSFISLRLVLPALLGLAAPGADAVLMVKPQFEVGRQQLGSGGVVRDSSLRSSAVLRVAQHAWLLGWGTSGLVASPLPGPSGNVEYFLWLRRGAAEPDADRVARAVAEGPV